MFLRHASAAGDDVAGVAGETLSVDVGGLADGVDGDADAGSVLGGLEETLLAVALDVELLAETILLGGQTAVSGEGEAAKAAGAAARIFRVVGSAGGVAGQAHSLVEVAIVALYAAALEVVGDAVSQPVLVIVDQPAASLADPVDVSEFALFAGLGVVVEVVAEGVDGLADVLVVEVVAGGALQADAIVFSGAALEEVDLWVGLASEVVVEGVAEVAGEADAVERVVGLTIPHALHAYAVLKFVSQHAADTGSLLAEGGAEVVGGHLRHQGDHCAQSSHAEKACNDDSHL
jgi:hypothetical protein